MFDAVLVPIARKVTSAVNVGPSKRDAKPVYWVSVADWSGPFSRHDITFHLCGQKTISRSDTILASAKALFGVYSAYLVYRQSKDETTAFFNRYSIAAILQ